MTASTRLSNANTSLQRKERKARNDWKPEEEGGLVIDPEFEALIPPLLTEDRDALEASLLSEGCRDALVVWVNDDNQVLIDGHNRYRLCKRHNISFEIVEHTFDSREDVMLWMLRNQRARRNLNDYMRGLMANKEKDILSAIYRRNQGKRTDLIKQDGDNLLHDSAKSSSNAWEDAAKANDTSRRTMGSVAYVEKNAEEFIKEKARSGDIAPRRAEEITKALQGASPEVIAVVKRFDVEDPSTITLLTHLHDKGRATFEEIAVSGFVQITDDTDAVPITAPSVSLYKAIEQKSDTHRVIGGQSSGVPAALLSSDSDEWYTPSVYIEAVRDVMGWIDIDPASNAEANKIVKASLYYDQASDGLSKPWDGKVFVNPPYGKADDESLSNQALWSARLLREYTAGRTHEAILLVNAITDAGWFQPLWDFPICFTDHRIRFHRPGGSAGQPVIGSAFVYFGDNAEGFAAVFRKFGAVVMQVIRGEVTDANAD